MLIFAVGPRRNWAYTQACEPGVYCCLHSGISPAPKCWPELRCSPVLSIWPPNPLKQPSVRVPHLPMERPCFLQAASTYFHICSWRSEICEPAPQQPGFRVTVLKHFPDCPVLSCHERGVPEVGFRLARTNKQSNYGTIRSQ